MLSGEDCNKALNRGSKPWDIVGHLQESKASPWKLSKKSEKGSKKARKRAERDYFSSAFPVFGSFSTHLRLCLEHIDHPFSDFFRSFQAEPFLTLADGQRHLNRGAKPLLKRYLVGVRVDLEAGALRGLESGSIRGTTRDTTRALPQRAH